MTTSATEQACSMSEKHLAELHSYMKFYYGKEEVYGDTGWPMSIAHAIKAALDEIARLHDEHELLRKRLAETRTINR